MSGIMCSQGGHRIAGQMAKAFSSAYTPRHLCLPGIFTSLLRTVQSRKALLPVFLSEGGMASSTSAAQFMKALTRIAWSVIGRRTSLSEEIPCRDVHLARCLQFAMHKFRLSLFVKDLEPGGSTTFCFLIV